SANEPSGIAFSTKELNIEPSRLIKEFKNKTGGWLKLENIVEPREGLDNEKSFDDAMEPLNVMVSGFPADYIENKNDGKRNRFRLPPKSDALGPFSEFEDLYAIAANIEMLNQTNPSSRNYQLREDVITERKKSGSRLAEIITEKGSLFE
ncbi:MAG: hypothetical protein GY761_11390, partial [Hyphomicrobiales bacterium]|nr:hypothetical protein [Hyphomicrobiales bacterium]